ncbi:MAG: SRPBCC domain-containing protein [Candidatus Paceibacterota bacterium]|jgi:uncharacterized protein YndB with AHSA1/START domain
MPKTTPENEIFITREFDAPREVVWKAWSDPEIIKKWHGPKNFTAPHIKNDFKIGGKSLYCMRGPDGKEYWSTGTYKKIVPPSKIIVTDSFADEKGNVVPGSYYGMNKFPLELLATITFEEIEGNKTKMSLRHAGVPKGQMSDLTKQGWNESFDKLAEALK